MLHFTKKLILFFLIYNPIVADTIETFYGPVDVQEPVLLELITSPAFQRLKGIHQYGVSYYTTHCENYTRYDHSLGVFFLLRINNCCLEEQIAGLLHDVSHTVFSHVGDWIFKRQHQEEDYQTLTHGNYLERSGLSEILHKYGYTIEDVLPKKELFPALEQPLPTLCADRIDYNLQGAFYQGFITYQEAARMFYEIKFIDGQWISNDYELLKKLVRFSLFMSQDCWGSATNYVHSMWLAEAILRGLDIQIIHMDDIRFGVDQEIWNCLLDSNDHLIRKNMHMILHASDYHNLVGTKQEANLLVTSKFRGIDPFVIIDGKRVRLTTTDPVLAEEFQIAKNRMCDGWAIKINTAIIDGQPANILL
ncbi:MAG TPA: HD domain-containing protein [Candidatus Babeliales bacterium]|nr:HD domain-containing protein [Candidatus Babeliales bacterium]